MTLVEPEATEVARVRAHIARAEARAALGPTRALSRAQRLVRALLLGELGRYRARGRFPRNLAFTDQRTIFVDAVGTRCAVAHLLELGGAAALVAEIATTRNYARVRALADDARVVAWLEAAGIGVDLAAAIQPEYCPAPRSRCVCGDEFESGPGVRLGPGGNLENPTGVLEVTVSGTTGDSGTSRARVDAVFGDGHGFAVGDEVVVGARDAATHGLVAVHAEEGASSGDGGASIVRPLVALSEGVLERCETEPFAASHPLTAAQIADAWVAGGDACRARVASIDPGWGTDTCASPSSGCAASPSPASDLTVGILLAIVGTLAARRARA